MANRKEIRELGALINQFQSEQPKKEITREDVERLEKDFPLDFIDNKLANPLESFEKVKGREAEPPELEKKPTEPEKKAATEEVKEQEEGGLPSLDEDEAIEELGQQEEGGLPSLDEDEAMEELGQQEEGGLPSLDEEEAPVGLGGVGEDEEGLPSLDGQEVAEASDQGGELPSLDEEEAPVGGEDEEGLPSLDGQEVAEASDQGGELPSLDEEEALGEAEDEEGLPSLDGQEVAEASEEGGELPSLDEEEALGGAEDEEGLPSLDGQEVAEETSEQGGELPSLDEGEAPVGAEEDEEGLPSLDGQEVAEASEEGGELPSLDEGEGVGEAPGGVGGLGEDEEGLPSLDGQEVAEASDQAGEGLPSLDEGEAPVGGEDEEGLPSLDGQEVAEASDQAGEGLPSLDEGEAPVGGEDEEGLPSLDGQEVAEASDQAGEGLPSLDEGETPGGPGGDEEGLPSLDGQEVAEASDQAGEGLPSLGEGEVGEERTEEQSEWEEEEESQKPVSEQNQEVIDKEIAKASVLEMPMVGSGFEESMINQEAKIPKPEATVQESTAKQEDAAEEKINQEELLEISHDIDQEISDFELDKKSDEFEEVKEPPIQLQSPKVSSPPQSDQSRKDKYNQALKKIKKFKLKNKKIVYQAIHFDYLNDEELEKLIDYIIEGKNENYIAEVASKIKLRKSIFEVTERRDRLLEEEQEIFNEVFSRRKYFLFIKQLVYLVIFFISLLSFYYITKDYIKSYRLYALSYDSIENDDFVRGEEYFADAFSTRPNISKTREIAELYADKQEFLRAEEKYELALSLNGRDYDTLLSYGDFFFDQGKYPEAEMIYQRYLSGDSDIADAFDNSQVIFLEKIGETYIQWGKEDPAKFDQAEETYNDLNKVNPSRRLFYHAKLLQVFSLTKDYNQAKSLYSFINSEDENAVFRTPFVTYLSFLNSTFKNYNSLEYIDFVREDLSRENQYMTRAIEGMLKKLEQEFPRDAQVFLEAAKWNDNTGDDERAEALALKSLRLHEEEPNGLRDFPLDELYAFLGEISYEKEDNLSAVNYFENSLEANENNPLANYYLGKISFVDLEQNERALNFFDRALTHWAEVKNGPQYLDILYNLGYLNFLKGKEQTFNDQEEEAQKSFESSLLYWNDLSDNISLDKNYLSDYALGLSYLYLEKYDLARSTFLVHLSDLRQNYQDFQRNEENNLISLEELKNRIYVLSDIYNNLGVIDLKESFDNGEVLNRNVFQESLNYFIDSIVIKDKLGLLPTIPNSNFHALNDLSPNSDLKDYFQISDQFLNKSLLF